MGIDQTTAIDMFYRQVIKEQRLPFQPAAALTLDERLIAAFGKSNPRIVELPADDDGNVLIDKKSTLTSTSGR
jgi:antitoxin component of RelBE/YafQ-DinJ toxin-antitoxin module